MNLDNMTQECWNRLPQNERNAAQDLSGLSPQLVGLEGYRVEVEDNLGKVRRFIVGRSSGWRPCHITLRTVRSRAGHPADRHFNRVTVIRRVRK